MLSILRSITMALIISLMMGCASTSVMEASSKPTLTQGAVQLNLIVGETTKAQVLEVFGAPNITTRDGAGNEVWSYQRQAQVSQSNRASSGWNILLAGSSRSASGFTTSSKMITLIIKFNDQDVVQDFRSRTSNF